MGSADGGTSGRFQHQVRAALPQPGPTDSRQNPSSQKEIQNKMQGEMLLFALFSSSSISDVLLGGVFDPE